MENIGNEPGWSRSYRIKIKGAPQMVDAGMVGLRPWKRMQEFLPPLSTYERKLLAESIRKYGILVPLIVLPDGRIIDGVHRYEIADEIGYEIPKDKIEILDLDEDEALALGLKLNIERRQLSPEQIQEIRARQRELALKLRKQGKTQEEVAKIIGVSQQTISYWEKNVNNTNIGKAYAPPDLRIKIPEEEYVKIYERYKSGETQEQIAADYKVSRPRITQIIKIVETRANSEEKEAEIDIPRFLDRLLKYASKRRNNKLKINWYTNSKFATIIIDRSLIEKFENGCLRVKEKLDQPINPEILIMDALENYWRRFNRALQSIETAQKITE